MDGEELALYQGHDCVMFSHGLAPRPRREEPVLCTDRVMWLLILCLLLCVYSIDFRIDKDQQRRLVFQQGENGVYTKIYAKVKKTR